MLIAVRGGRLGSGWLLSGAAGEEGWLPGPPLLARLLPIRPGMRIPGSASAVTRDGAFAGNAGGCWCAPLRRTGARGLAAPREIRLRAGPAGERSPVPEAANGG